MKKSLAGYFPVVTDFVFFWEGGKGGGRGEDEDNIPCSSLADAVS